MFVKQWLTFV
jgi:hypothetical protein